jgi:hypothetical protein
MDLKKFIAFNSEAKSEAHDPAVLESYARSLEVVNENLGKMLLMSAEIEKIREDLKHVVKEGEFKGAMVALLSQIEPLREEIARQVNTEVQAIRESFRTLTTKTTSLQKLVDEAVDQQNLRIINHFETQEQKLLDLRQAVEDRADLGPMKTKLEHVAEDVDYLKKLDIYDNLNATQEAAVALGQHIDDIDGNVVKLAKEILEFKQDMLDTSLVLERSTNARYQEALEALDENLRNVTTLQENLQDIEKRYDDLNKELTESNLAHDVATAELGKVLENIQKANHEHAEVLDEQVTHIVGNITTLKQELDALGQGLDQGTEAHAQSVARIQELTTHIPRLDARIDEHVGLVEQEIKSLSKTLLEQNTRIQDSHRDLKAQVAKVITDGKMLLEREQSRIDGDTLFEDRYDRIIKRVEEVEGMLADIDAKTEHNDVIYEHVRTSSDRLDAHADRLMQKLQETANQSISDLKKKTKLLNEAAPTDIAGINAGLGVDTRDLDKKFVTFQQLRDHYRQFVDRVQRQLAENIGGGGAQFLWDLDDVDINTVRYPGNGELLIWSGALRKWISGNAFTISTVQGNLTVQESIEVLGNANIYGFLTVGGNIILGDATTDNFTLGADVNSDILPDVSSTYNLGSVSQTWGNIHVDSVYVDNLWAAGNIMPATDNVHDLGNATHRWRDLYLSGNSLYIGTTSFHDTGAQLEIKYNGNVALRSDTTGNIRANLFIGDLDGRVSNIANHTTDALREGTANLYHTVARVRTNIFAGTGVLYNNVTGQIRISQNVDPEVDVQFSNVTITGNLNVLGAAANFEANILNVQDPSIIFGDGNPSDTYDLGIHGEYVSSGTRYSGLFRDASADGRWKLYANLTNMPQNFVDTSSISFNFANLELNHVHGRVTLIDNFTTTDLVEGANLYFTNTRVWANVGTNIGNLNSWVSSNSSNIGNINSWLRTTNSNVGNLNAWTSSNSSNIGNLNAWTSSNSSNIGNINSWLRTTNSNIGNINGWVSSNSTNIGNLNAWTSNNSANIGNINTWLRTITTTGVAEGANLYYTDDRVWGNVGTNIGNLNAWVSSNSTNIGNLNSWVSSNSSNIGNLNAWTSSNSTNIGNLNAWTSSNSSNIGNLNSWVTNVYTSIPTSANNINSITTLAAPATTGDAGTAGEVRFDGNYFYVCIASNTWRRANLHTW